MRWPRVKRICMLRTPFVCLFVLFFFPLSQVICYIIILHHSHPISLVHRLRESSFSTSTLVGYHPFLEYRLVPCILTNLPIHQLVTLIRPSIALPPATGLVIIPARGRSLVVSGCYLYPVDGWGTLIIGHCYRYLWSSTFHLFFLCYFPCFFFFLVVDGVF